MRAYHQLNRLAVSVLEPGGILVTCSCSGHVTREDFMFTFWPRSRNAPGVTFRYSKPVERPPIIR